MTPGEHEREVRSILRKSGCMNEKGEIRNWKRGTWSLLNQSGHDSLSPKKCRCTKENPDA